MRVTRVMVKPFYFMVRCGADGESHRQVMGAQARLPGTGSHASTKMAS